MSKPNRDPKYIIFDSELDYFPVVFPNHVQHGNIALMMGNFKSISAGFFRVEDGKVVVFGESISLKLNSNPETDEKYLTKMLNL